MILIIDNYDSFTYNLVHLIGALSPNIIVKRNDAITATDAINMKPSGIVLSPGPCDPDQANLFGINTESHRKRNTFIGGMLRSSNDRTGLWRGYSSLP